MKIPVTFRIDKTPQDGRTEVTAVFLSRDTHPTLLGTNRVCYAHVGQHGECSLQWAHQNTRPATPDEYAPLLRELEQRYSVEGDTLDVRPAMHEQELEG